MTDFIPTRAAALKKEASSTFTTATFVERKKKDKSDVQEPVKRKSLDSQDEISDYKQQQEKEMKKARWDVMKFGISGFKKNEAYDAKVALAISLGAKPPKNKSVNYKVLKSQREKEKRKEAKAEKFKSGLSSSLLPIKKQNKNNSKKDSGIMGSYGKITKPKSKSKKRK